MTKHAAVTDFMLLPSHFFRPKSLERFAEIQYACCLACVLSRSEHRELIVILRCEPNWASLEGCDHRCRLPSSRRARARSSSDERNCAHAGMTAVFTAFPTALPIRDYRHSVAAKT